MTMDKQLLAESYTNQDVAYALELPNFVHYRKNWDRDNFVKLPRIEALGRAGSQFRLAHIYEYALMSDLQRAVSRGVASSVIFTRFREMRRSAVSRINELPPEDRRALEAGRSFIKDQDPFDFGGFVDFPGIYFDPEFLDRDPENPLFWIFDAAEAPSDGLHPGEELLQRRAVLKVRGNKGLADVFKELRSEDLKNFVNPDLVPRWSAFSAINVTDTLMRIDDALNLRLRGRQLAGRSVISDG